MLPFQLASSGGSVLSIREAPRSSFEFTITAILRLMETLQTLFASAPHGASSLSSSLSSEKPARPRAGFSFGNHMNDLRFMAQVVGLRKDGAIQRLSERLLHSPAITSAASSYRAHPGWRFATTANLSTDQVNDWNKYSDTLVRYSRNICVNRRDKYHSFLAYTSCAYVESYRVNKSAQARVKRASSRKRRLSRR